ncbi:hypothetical protein IQ249_08080 [Lusitaniella coriacea LEGE 07157]|uniref:Uncharacterized protein n=1 Tax=Lusitaniella coriacea LEGE 07157 TaxID=945747 RepID=A0A8J7DW40_9CYAN|nr:hypothetical protein [Lusitaniella coriacea]MBE9115848.1 hypothetical protein [Lusitaniella coriacea LEGE 07157]
MSDRVLIILGLSTLVMGFSPIVRAQPVTLQGESLRTIESRTARENYQEFFKPQTSEVQIESDANESSSPSFIENLGIVFGSRVSYPDYMDVFNAPAEGSDSQGVQFKLPFNAP